jgi:hypothetical protein
VKAVVAEKLSGPSGLVYTDVDDIPDRVDGAVVIDVRAAGLKPPPPLRYPLSKAAEALQLLADGGVLGKLVLEP